MYLLGEQPAYAEQLINRLQGIPAQLLEGLAPSAPPIELKGSDDLAEDLQGYSLYKMSLYEVMYQCTAPMMCFGARPLADNRYQ